MKVLVQRAARAEVRVGGAVVGAISHGLVVFVGVEKGDTAKTASWYAEKLVGLRVFTDAQGHMNLSIQEAGGQMLVVSQFTLAASTRRGRRPSFEGAADPAVAQPLYELLCAEVRRRGVTVATGVFRAHMQVDLVNDGPVTFLLDPPGAP